METSRPDHHLDTSDEPDLPPSRFTPDEQRDILFLIKILLEIDRRVRKEKLEHETKSIEAPPTE